MAVLRLSPPFLLLIIALMTLLLTPVLSLDCKSEKFTNKKMYSNCTNLPTLNSTLHYTFSSENSTLSVAFTAPPASSDGWVAWAINPTGTGMAGCQSFIAFKDSKGSMVVKTYNISSYASIVQGKIAFDVVDSSAEFSNGVMTIFASVKLPETLMGEFNHLWQVGSSVKNGVPVKHAFLPDNLKAMAKLQLDVKASNVTTGGSNVTATGSSAANSPTTAPNNNSASGNGGIHGIIIFVACLFALF
uniref:DOMON domain-containing protein n=1 Tax=Tanacetum cinerariifolium TaxID=118510 RepID=A0A699KC48_TANCI|nr:DOMON domain-containing protein [Tanacetum cinerariifolium]